ncbi:16542_t:CDS:2, partial [Funneliformis geosporum]
EQLKKRIREITNKKLTQINSLPMALPDLLRDITTAIDCVELYVDRDRSFDPKNTLNGIRITLTTVRIHMQRVANETLHYQGNIATLPDVLNSIAPLLAQIPQYVGQELPNDYYNKVMQAINYGHSLGV